MAETLTPDSGHPPPTLHSTAAGAPREVNAVPEPLRTYLISKSRNPVDLLNAATLLFGGSVATSPLGGLCGGDHELRGVAAHDFAVGYFASPLDVRVASAQGRRSYFVNIGVSGAISAARGSLRATLDRSTAGVVNPGDSQELRPVRARGTRFLGLRIDAALVDQEFRALTGHPPLSPIRFDFALDLGTSKGRAVRLLVRSLLEQLDSGDPLFQRSDVQHGQLRSLVTALLLAQPHSHTAELRAGGPPPGHPRAVRVALAFIEANLTERISLSDIAQAAHCSPRTISSAFRDRLGLSPLSYVRSLRLDRIRADILASTDPVGTIAYRWGVSHLGRFASAYRDRFAELPSDTAARR
ncbi:AraC family transcriptional regulator [Streptomyces sp. NPDC048612]|uniref:helix-turn-helix transcriptional regulator n=1 Tax=Streptomyces sp. NPDC048612 TaxID=3365579 RepID=UPI0037195976